MNHLASIIKAEIESQGAISVARYMELSLQHPTYGYYRHEDPLGVDGDFTTSPEISPMFGELVGLWLASAWQKMGSPTSFALLELGPGRGTLMQDALRATAKIKGFHEGMKLFLYESNETLRTSQKEKLSDYAPVFLEDLAALPTIPLFFVANEFFDAMPVHQFVRREQGWAERMVCCVNDRLAFADNAQSGLSLLASGELEDLSFYETSPASCLFAREIAEKIALFGGAGLVVDYGYALPPNASTLQAVSRHAEVDLFDNPGDVDLTAHVDFARLGNVFRTTGLTVMGPVGQGDFLKTLGIELRAAQLSHKASSEQEKEIATSLRRLVDPAEMGVLFKAMAVAHRDISELDGF